MSVPERGSSLDSHNDSATHGRVVYKLPFPMVLGNRGPRKLST